MERPQQLLQIVQLYYENGRFVKSVSRALRPIHGVHNRPTNELKRSCGQHLKGVIFKK